MSLITSEIKTRSFFTESVRAKIALILATLLWSSSFVGIRYVIQFYSPVTLALLRYLIASCCMGLIYYCTYCKSPLYKWIDIRRAIFLGVIGFALYNIFLNYGEQQISASMVSFIIGLSPVIVAILAVWTYKEQLDLSAKYGFIISLLGLIVMTSNELSTIHKFTGILFTFTAMISLAIFSLMKKKLMERMSAIEFTTYAIWGGTASMLIFIPKLLAEIKHSSLTAALVVFYLGVFPGALSYLFSNYGYTKLPVAKAACYSYLIPIFTTILAFVFLREKPSFTAIVGGICTFLGAIIVANSQIKVITSNQLVKV